MDQNLLNLDYLVFSSHKTATQTICHSLIRSGVAAKHTHYLETLKIAGVSDFQRYLKEYLSLNQRPLKIISVMRNPFERILSSFFYQRHNDEIRINMVAADQTTVTTSSIEQLCSLLVSLILRPSDQKGKMYGYTESLDLLFSLLGEEQISFESESPLFSVYTHPLCHIYVALFDTITLQMKQFLCQLTGSDSVMVEARNISNENPMYSKRLEFERAFVYSSELKEQILSDRWQSPLITNLASLVLNKQH